MLVINSIEKSRLSADSYSYSGTGVAWKARLVLFLGFALMAGGLAGSIVHLPNPRAQPVTLTDDQAVMVLKYLVPAYPFPTLYFGVANVVANALIMLRHVLSIMVHDIDANIHSSSVVLWVSQNMEDDYTYNLAL